MASHFGQVGELAFGEESVQEFIDDIGKSVYGDTITFAGRRYFTECFALHGTAARDHFVEHSSHLRTAMFSRPHGHYFCEGLAEYFPAPGWKLKRGTAWTARRMARHDGLVFNHADRTAAAYEAAILNSTPFSDYFEADS